MAASSRLSSAMLSRVANPASRQTATLSTRTFSTSLAFRLPPPNSNSNRETARAPRQRSNPLVGNFTPPQPKQQEATPAVTEHTKPSSPEQAVAPESDAGIPFPPPPPPAASPGAASETAPKSDEVHPYTAADSSTPLNLDIASIIANKSAAYGRSLGVGDPLTRPKLRTKAVLGHTVFIKDRMTPTSAPSPMAALRVLERMCREQKVRNKFHMQKFHERPGLKRKRLRSQRWRARFKTGFKAAVSRVLELKKQGW